MSITRRRITEALSARRGTLAVLMAAAALWSPHPATADIWRVTKGYCEVRFSWNNLGLSRQSATATDVDGTLDFTPTDPTAGAVDIRIRAASIQSGVREFDELLKRPEFFDAAQYPSITFKSTAVRPTGERTGEVIGDLTVRGVTRPVVLVVKWNFTGEHPLAPVNPTYLGNWVTGFSARGSLKRSDFGLDRGVPLVSDEVEIEIEAEFTRKKE